MTGFPVTGGANAPRRFRRAASGSVILAFLSPIAVGAQAVTAPPDFRVLRYDEDWSPLREAPTGDPFDPVKYIPFDDSGRFFLSFGGQLRTRAEGVRNFQLSSGASNRDSFALLRAMLHGDLHAGEYLRAFVEGKHSLAISRDLPGGRRPLDQDEWELQNAFVELSCCGAATAAVTARAGRQELLLGSQRLVSPLDWSNTRRTFDGGRLLGRAGGIAGDLFVTRPVTIRVDERNRNDSASSFWGTAVRSSVPGAVGWEIYLLGLHQEGTPLWGYQGDHERYTLGSRLTGGTGASAVRFEVEGGWQFGELAGNDVSAWFVASDLSHALPFLPLGPTVTIGADYASGDHDGGDTRVGTFHQLFPLAHAYAGYMDLLGRQNLIEFRAVVAGGPSPRLQGRTAIHRFLRASRRDAVYNAGGGVFRQAVEGSRSIGTELDLSLAYRLDRHLRFEAGYGHFWPGMFLEATPGGAVGADWGYISTAFTF